MKKLMNLLLISLLATACASQSKDPKAVNVFDPITLKDLLVEGKTTQSQVLQTLGAPDMTSEDETKRDVWVYNKNKQETGASGYGLGGALSMLPGPLSYVSGAFGSGKVESSSSSVNLVLIFNKNKTIRSYNLSKVRI